MEYKNSCFVFWWPIPLYFNMMYVCFFCVFFCGALVVNKLFPIYMSMCSSCRGIVTETRKCFWGHNNALKLHMTMLFPHTLPPTIPASEMSCFLAQAPGLISQALKRAPCSLWSLLFMAHCNCWKCHLHPAWLSTRKKMQRDAWVRLWFSGSVVCQPQGQKNWSRQHPL